MFSVRNPCNDRNGSVAGADGPPLSDRRGRLVARRHEGPLATARPAQNGATLAAASFLGSSIVNRRRRNESDPEPIHDAVLHAAHRHVATDYGECLKVEPPQLDVVAKLLRDITKLVFRLPATRVTKAFTDPIWNLVMKEMEHLVERYRELGIDPPIGRRRGRQRPAELHLAEALAKLASIAFKRTVEPDSEYVARLLPDKGRGDSVATRKDRLRKARDRRRT